MKIPVSALLIIMPALYSSACSSPGLHSTQGKDTASISFIRMNTAMPELSIKLRGKSYSVNKDMIEKRPPGSHPTMAFNIPAGEEIIIDYNNFSVNNLPLSPTLKCSANPAYGCMPDFEAHREVTVCSKTIALTAQRNKKYTVSVEATHTNNCRIEIKEIFDEPERKQKTSESI